MKQLPCEVIRDLLPLYVDGLTSDTTNDFIRKHLETCEECRKSLAAMQEAEPEIESDAKEIDFLKKNKRRNKKVLIGSILGCLALLVGFLALRFYVVGSILNGDWVACDLNVSEGKNLTMDGTVIDSLHGVSKVNVTEEANGIIRIQTRAVIASPLHSGHFHLEYQAENFIQQIWLNDRIIWDHGEIITKKTAEIFEARHPYVGDMSANQRLAGVLRVKDYLGPYENELETASEPYGWKLILQEQIPEESLVVMENDMESLAYLMIGLIDNLDHVTFVGHHDGGEFFKTVTAQRATQFFGRDIKDCGKSVRVLSTLIWKTGLYFEDQTVFSPDSVKIYPGVSVPKRMIASERDPETVSKLYTTMQNIQLTEERIEADSPELNQYTLISLKFASDQTGQSRSFQLLGPYWLCVDEGNYYYARIQNGEEIYDECCTIMKELEEKEKSRR